MKKLILKYEGMSEQEKQNLKNIRMNSVLNNAGIAAW